MRTNLETVQTNRNPQKKNENKIAIVTVFAVAGVVFLAGCISINVNRAPCDNPSSAAKSGSTTNAPGGTTNSMYIDKKIGVASN